jgi:hypothetical protein
MVLGSKAILAHSCERGDAWSRGLKAVLQIAELRIEDQKTGAAARTAATRSALDRTAAKGLLAWVIVGARENSSPLGHTFQALELPRFA